MKDYSFRRYVQKLGKRLACLASSFLKPITIFKWTGIFPFLEIPGREISVYSYKYEEQSPLGFVQPRSIRADATWTPNPFSVVVMSHMVEIEEGFASHDGYMFDNIGRLVRQASHKYRDKIKRAHAIQPHKIFPTICRFDYEVAIVTASNQHFYWHWLFDILPRLLMLEDVGKNVEKIYIQKRYSFQCETLQALGIFSDEKIIDCDKVPIISASKLIVPCHQIAGGREFPNWVCQVLRERFLPFNADRKDIVNHRIYISRKNARFRRVLNEDEVVALLKQYGFIVVMLENLAFREQVNLFQNAEVVVGASGSGLANLVFCQAETKVIELFPTSTHDANFRLCRTLNLDYYFLTDPESKLGTWGYDDYVVNNLRIDLKELREILHLAGISASEDAVSTKGFSLNATTL